MPEENRNPDVLGRIMPREALLATKLLIPPVQPHLVPRSRLTDLLDGGLSRKLVLLSAPAGYGKTTLLSEWIQGSHVVPPWAGWVSLDEEDVVPPWAGWVSLDEEDNDPARFWAYVIGAIEMAEPNVGKCVRTLLDSVSQCPIQMVLTTIINALSVLSQSPGPRFALSAHGSEAPPQQEFGRNALILVLDDYHMIHARAIHRAMTFLLEHLPPQVHLVIATRTAPPLPLARLRAHDQLLELHGSDLRFRSEEITAFLRGSGLNLSEERIADLEALTEGWIAGLQLSALSMKSQQGWQIPSRHSLGSDERHISEYLVTEVLNRQTASIKNFLLETSILESLTGSLCDAVTGNADSRAMLEMLDHANLFIMPLDTRREWYRYQHLFRDTLRARLEETRPNRISLLHRRASEWYEKNGLPSRAITHALAASDFERAADLIELNAPLLWNRGEVSAPLSWLDSLPQELVRSRPRLGLARAWALLGVGQPDAIEPHLKIVEEALAAREAEPTAAQDTDQLQSEILVIRAFAATIRGDTGRGIELSRRALDQLAADDLRLRTMITHNLAVACEFNGELPTAAQALTEASAVAQAAGDLFLTIVINRHLGLVQRDQGHLREAMQSFRQTIDLAEKNGFQNLPVVGLHHVGLGDVLRERNDLEGATQHLLKGIDLIKQFCNMFFLVDGYIGLARVKQSQGDVEGGLAILAEASEAVREQGMPRTVAKIAAHQARLWLMQGNVEAAERWARTDLRRAQVKDYELDNIEQMTLARLLAAQGRAGEAIDCLTRLLRQTEMGGRTGNVIEILSLQALIIESQGDSPRALSTLKRALALAQPEGYLRTFADEGLPMISMLLALRHSKRTGPSDKKERTIAEYVTKVLKACNAADSGQLLSEQGHVADPLSRREIEILQLIVAGLSTRDIAEKLMVSVNTVKAHRKSIYSKLAVGTRLQAIERAKKLHLN